MGLCCDPLLKPLEGLITIIEKSESTKSEKNTNGFPCFPHFLSAQPPRRIKEMMLKIKIYIYFFVFISIATISHKKCCCYGRSIVELSGYCFDYIFASSFFKRSIVTIYNTPIFLIYIQKYMYRTYTIYCISVSFYCVHAWICFISQRISHRFEYISIDMYHMNNRLNLERKWREWLLDVKQNMEENTKKLSNVSVLIVFFSFSISLIRTIACNH